MRAAEQLRVLQRALEADAFTEQSDEFVARARLRHGNPVVSPRDAREAYEVLSTFLGEPLKEGTIDASAAWACPTFGLANYWVRLLHAREERP